MKSAPSSLRSTRGAELQDHKLKPPCSTDPCLATTNQIILTLQPMNQSSQEATGNKLSEFRRSAKIKKNNVSDRNAKQKENLSTETSY